MATEYANSPASEHEAHRSRRLGRLLGDSVGEALRFLPELAADLRAIRHNTETMASEVRGMHSAVRRVEHEVQGLRGDVMRLEQRMVEVESGMARLEPHIADVNLAVRPLRRARARLPQRAATADSTNGDQPPL